MFALSHTSKVFLASMDYVGPRGVILGTCRLTVASMLLQSVVDDAGRVVVRRKSELPLNAGKLPDGMPSYVANGGIGRDASFKNMSHEWDRTVLPGAGRAMVPMRSFVDSLHAEDRAKNPQMAGAAGRRLGCSAR